MFRHTKKQFRTYSWIALLLLLFSDTMAFSWTFGYQPGTSWGGYQGGWGNLGYLGEETWRMPWQQSPPPPYYKFPYKLALEAWSSPTPDGKDTFVGRLHFYVFQSAINIVPYLYWAFPMPIYDFFTRTFIHPIRSLDRNLGWEAAHAYGVGFNNILMNGWPTHDGQWVNPWNGSHLVPSHSRGSFAFAYARRRLAIYRSFSHGYGSLRFQPHWDANYNYGGMWWDHVPHYAENWWISQTNGYVDAQGRWILNGRETLETWNVGGLGRYVFYNY